MKETIPLSPKDFKHLHQKVILKLCWAQWYMLVILGTWEVEIGRIMVQGHTWHIAHETPFQPRKMLIMVACACHPS
jgi:hypothetical protein